ncbi:unnamed protein product [Moneuplotes crassus]|uniref:Uncharacterized protein n=1 Tax=Euplotes crassus TaxID=5936 RepID=A0AAD1Y331_EUPCR|nr:unnamed protein product [Moneuplotes crassus]
MDDLIQFRTQVEEFYRSEENKSMNEIYEKVSEKEVEVKYYQDQLAESNNFIQELHSKSNEEIDNLKNQLIDMKNQIEVYKDENQAMKEEVERKDQEIQELKEEKEGRARIHQDEIDKLSVKHKQQLYLYKKKLQNRAS